MVRPGPSGAALVFWVRAAVCVVVAPFVFLAECSLALCIRVPRALVDLAWVIRTFLGSPRWLPVPISIWTSFRPFLMSTALIRL